jgi:nitrite reductase/ring-hydroxylating ferredoxin subunit
MSWQVRCAATGEFLVDKKIRARTFPVSVEGDDIFIVL